MERPGPIFVITGPPGAGKTTVSKLVLQHFALGLHVPVDDLREWVCQGLSSPIEWTEATQRQFELAEDAAVDVAERYARAGFAVAIDHCRGPDGLVRWEQRSLLRFSCTKVLLLPALEVNLTRNRADRAKNFNTEVLEEIIDGLQRVYRAEALAGWTLVDSSMQSPQETAMAVLQMMKEKADA